MRTFVDLGHALAALLHSLGQQHGAPAYALQVLQAFPSAAPAVTVAAAPAAGAHPDDKLIEPLTFRELEVLALLSERLSNKEIAQLLVLSPHTVKAHVHHIFAKLQVTQRREAIARAKSLGLLSL